MTYKQIAEKYGVTETAVYAKLREYHIVAQNVDHRQGLPWRISVQAHRMCYPAHMLRCHGRVLAGEALKPAEARAYTQWVQALTRDGMVVYYHPDVPPNAASPIHGGWAYVPARPGETLIRQPPRTLCRSSRRA